MDHAKPFGGLRHALDESPANAIGGAFFCFEPKLIRMQLTRRAPGDCSMVTIN